MRSRAAWLLAPKTITPSTTRTSISFASTQNSPAETGPYQKTTTGPGANAGSIYVVAGSSGWATFTTGHHPVMFSQELRTGSLVLDINSNRLDAVFLRETGAIDDSFTIIKNPAEPLRLCT